MKADSKARNAPGRHAASRWLTWYAAAVAAAYALPLVFLGVESARAGPDVLQILTSERTLGPLRRSLTIAVTSAAGAGIVGTALAWLIELRPIPGRRLWQVAVPLPLVIPSFVGATALRFTFGAGGLIPFVPRFQGFLGAWLALVLFTYPYVYLPVAARLRSSSGNLEDAARLLGSTPRQVFRDVTWPQIRPAVAGGSLLVFLYALSDFGAVSIMRYDTLTRAIFSARLAAPTTALALGFLLAVLALGVAGLERRVGGGRFRTEAPSRDRARTATVPAHPLAVLAPFCAVGLALVAPVASFLYWWVRGTRAGGGGLGDMAATLAGLSEAALNSTLAGTLAAVVAVVVLTPVAYVVARSAGRVGVLVSRLTAATFALPGVVLAFAIVYWVVRAPDFIFLIYQTMPLLIAAYVIHFGAQALRPIADAVRSLPPALSEAAGTLGAGPARRLRTVQLPLMAPGMAAAGGLMLLSVLKELPATLMLAPIGFPTLATKVWGAAEEGFLADAGAASLALIALSAVLTWLLVLRPSRTAS